jgi:hypothetical protein
MKRFYINYKHSRRLDNSISIFTRLLTRRLGFDSWQGKRKEFTTSKPTLRSNQPVIQWVSGLNGRDVNLTIYLNLVPRIRIYGAIPPIPQTFSWGGATSPFTFTNIVATRNFNIASGKFNAGYSNSIETGY